MLTCHAKLEAIVTCSQPEGGKEIIPHYTALTQLCLGGDWSCLSRATPADKGPCSEMSCLEKDLALVSIALEGLRRGWGFG